MKKNKLKIKNILITSLISTICLIPNTAKADWEGAVIEWLSRISDYTQATTNSIDTKLHPDLEHIKQNQLSATQSQNAHQSTLQQISVREKNHRAMFQNKYDLEQKYQAPSISAAQVAGVADVAAQVEADTSAQKSKFAATLLHRKLNSDLNFMEKTKSFAEARNLYQPNGNMPNADISIDSILTGSGLAGKSNNLTFNEKQIDAGARYIMNAVSANIPPPLPTNMQNTSKGQDYEMARREALSKMSLAQKIHTDALAYRTPVNSLAGEGGKKISHAEFISNQINSRYGNQAWLVGLESGSDNRLFKELLYMKALDLKMREQEIEHLEKISLGIAQLLDNSSSSQLDSLRTMRETAVKQGVQQQMRKN